MKGYLKDNDSRDTVKPSDWLDKWWFRGHEHLSVDRFSWKKDMEGTLCLSGDIAFIVRGVWVKQLQMADYF